MLSIYPILNLRISLYVEIYLTWGGGTVFSIEFPRETYYVYHADAGDIYLRATFSSDPAHILYDKKNSFTEMDIGKINKAEITLTFDVVSKATGVSQKAKNINEGIQGDAANLLI
ncbi:hypothetical protein [Citrobacter sp. Cy070]|uniref:hypothetical protein n=1 Tax=Citrobacter sp. Cy070 TaxID=2985161 RepID=UPI002574C660|nr:hypothetical protein [Citrobacter sp. Cy070]MDM2730287.1 hypothetical protein [Citrobacter sp. Cy070]